MLKPISSRLSTTLVLLAGAFTGPAHAAKVLCITELVLPAQVRSLLGISALPKVITQENQCSGSQKRLRLGRNSLSASVTTAGAQGLQGIQGPQGPAGVGVPTVVDANNRVLGRMMTRTSLSDPITSLDLYNETANVAFTITMDESGAPDLASGSHVVFYRSTDCSGTGHIRVYPSFLAATPAQAFRDHTGTALRSNPATGNLVTDNMLSSWSSGACQAATTSGQFAPLAAETAFDTIPGPVRIQ